MGGREEKKKSTLNFKCWSVSLLGLWRLLWYLFFSLRKSLLIFQWRQCWQTPAPLLKTSLFVGTEHTNHTILIQLTGIFWHTDDKAIIFISSTDFNYFITLKATCIFCYLPSPKRSTVGSAAFLGLVLFLGSNCWSSFFCSFKGKNQIN